MPYTDEKTGDNGRHRLILSGFVLVQVCDAVLSRAHHQDSITNLDVSDMRWSGRTPRHAVNYHCHGRLSSEAVVVVLLGFQTEF